MLPYLVSSVGFLLAIMLQYGVVGRAQLAAGFGDIVLLFVAAWSLHQHLRRFWVVIVLFGALVGFMSAVPTLAILAVYLAVYFAAASIRFHTWQSPLLAMFVLTFFGTLLEHTVFVAVQLLNGASVSIPDAVGEVLLPSVLINMLLAIPVHALIQEVTRSITPTGLEV